MPQVLQTRNNPIFDTQLWREITGTPQYKSQIKINDDSALEHIQSDYIGQLTNAINSKQGNIEENAKAWVYYHFRDNINTFDDSTVDKLALIAGEYGTNSDYIKIADRLISNGVKFSADYLIMLDRLFQTGVADPDTSWIYDNSLYNESVEDNILKLKAILFVADKNNVRKWGLLKDKKTGEFLTVDDLIGKSKQEMFDLIDNSATKDPTDTDNEDTFRDVAKALGHEREDDIIKFYTDLATEVNNKETSELFADYIKDSYNRRTFLNTITSTERYKQDFESFLDKLTNEDNEEEGRTRGGNVRNGGKVRDYLAQNNIAVVDLYRIYSPKLQNRYRGQTLSNRRALFAEILGNKNFSDMLLNYPLRGTDEAGFLNTLVSFLDSVNELKKKQRQMDKNRIDMTKNPEVNALYRRIADYMESEYNIPANDVKRFFEREYRSGMTERQIIDRILATA